MINKFGDMPSFQSVGEMPRWVREAGFEDVQLADMTRNVVPMMWLFWILAIVPYLFVRSLSVEAYFPNVVAGVEMYRGRKDWHYMCISGRKPLQP